MASSLTDVAATAIVLALVVARRERLDDLEADDLAVALAATEHGWAHRALVEVGIKMVDLRRAIRTPQIPRTAR